MVYPAAGYWPTSNPFGDDYQNFVQNYGFSPADIGLPDLGSRRTAPRELPYREYRKDFGWWQGDRKLRNFKPNYYMTRPHDGKRSGTLGRLKDVVTGEGPDVFVTINGDKRTLMKDRPKSWQWNGWGPTGQELRNILTDKDFREQDLISWDMPWTEGDRAKKPFYNFRNREYEYPKPSWLRPNGVWTNAQWAPGARHDSRTPLNKRDYFGLWWSRVPRDAEFYAGGRPHWNI